MIVIADDITQMWHEACTRLLFSTRDEVGFANGTHVNTYDNVFVAKSMAFDYDVGLDSWFAETRWRKLQRDYLVPAEVLPFIERCVEIAEKKARNGVITQMTFRQNERRPNARNHSWGNCLMDVTYRGGAGVSTPTFVMHSRVGYLTYLGGLDLSLVWVIAREVAERTGLNVEEFQLRWYLDSCSHHCFKSIPYIVSGDHLEEVMNEETYPGETYPAIRASRRSITRIKSHPKEFFTFGMERQIVQRWDRVENGEGFPSLHVTDLSLLPEMMGEPRRKR